MFFFTLLPCVSSMDSILVFAKAELNIFCLFIWYSSRLPRERRKSRAKKDFAGKGQWLLLSESRLDSTDTAPHQTGSAVCVFHNAAVHYKQRDSQAVCYCPYTHSEAARQINKKQQVTQILLISSHKGHLEYRIQLVRAWKNYTFPPVTVCHLKRGHQVFLCSLRCEPPPSTAARLGEKPRCQMALRFPPKPRDSKGSLAVQNTGGAKLPSPDHHELNKAWLKAARWHRSCPMSPPQQHLVCLQRPGKEPNLLMDHALCHDPQTLGSWWMCGINLNSISTAPSVSLAHLQNGLERHRSQVIFRGESAW